MGYTERIQNLLDEKTDEINRLELELIEARACVSSIRESLRLASRSTQRMFEVEQSTIEPKKGSIVEKARDYLRSTGKPAHISEILRGIGRENTYKNRLSTARSIDSYVKKGEIFVRPKANTFGLICMKVKDGNDGPLADFGVDPEPAGGYGP